jgi:predicted acyl esterase
MNFLKKRSPTIISTIFYLVIIGALSVGAETPIANPGITVKKDVPLVLSDGIKLYADIYLPAPEGKYPVILMRTPYNKEDLKTIGESFASAQYAVLIQDVRGQGKSEGQFFPFTSEREDGLATLDWIELQPWSNGKIGIWGISYLAYNGFVLLPSQHGSLKAFVASSGFADIDSFLFHGGAFRLQAQLTWFMSQSGNFKMPPPEARSKVFEQIFRTVPLSKFFAGNEDAAENFQDISEEFSKVKTPVLFVTGWHDYIYRNMLNTYKQIKKHQKKAFHKLIIGPWYHGQELNGGTIAGDEDFGAAAEMGHEKFMELSVRWFDYWLKGEDDGISQEDPVKIFVMGRNEWKGESSWPPDSVQYQNWYISSTKGANSLNGDGLLSSSVPEVDSFDSFTYDPNNPVPTVGGVNFHFFPNNLGIKDQTEVEARKDVLVYTSAPLKKSMEIVGPLKAVIYASTEGVDTDFTAKLVEVRPSGYARIIEDGILRARYRNSLEDPSLLEPGEIHKFEIVMGYTAYLKQQFSQI